MLMPPPRCWRNRTDCEPLHAIEALPEVMSDDDWTALETGAMDPPSFVCAGCVRPADRAIAQDAYRVCWKNDAVDEIGDYDEQDLAHTAAVIVQAMAIIATRRVNGGMIDVPTLQGEAGA